MVNWQFNLQNRMKREGFDVFSLSVINGKWTASFISHVDFTGEKVSLEYGHITVSDFLKRSRKI